MKSLVLAASVLVYGTAALAQVPPATVQQPATQQKRSAEPKKLDLNGDGFVSREEAKGDPGLERRFGRIDANNDGRLSQDELKTFRERREARREDKQRSQDDEKHGDKPDDERGFAAIDADKDGFLTRKEIKGRPELQKRFQEIDSNNDNRLSREEMRAARRKP